MAVTLYGPFNVSYVENGKMICLFVCLKDHEHWCPGYKIYNTSKVYEE